MERRLKMGFNDPDKLKILRTQLDEETHRQFKLLAVKLDKSMADLLEDLVKAKVAENKLDNQS